MWFSGGSEYQTDHENPFYKPTFYRLCWGDVFYQFFASNSSKMNVRKILIFADRNYQSRNTRYKFWCCSNRIWFRPCRRRSRVRFFVEISRKILRKSSENFPNLLGRFLKLISYNWSIFSSLGLHAYNGCIYRSSVSGRSYIGFPHCTYDVLGECDDVIRVWKSQGVFSTTDPARFHTQRTASC